MMREKQAIMSAIIALIFFVIAALYAAVGSGGGSGYLAVMGLFDVTPAVMRPTALALNVLVTSISTFKYVRAGHFSGRIFWPVAAMSVPLAFIGGRLSLPVALYRPLLGLVLFYAAFRLYQSTRRQGSGAEGGEKRVDLPLWIALLVGGVLGLVSGVMGIGGGIFLSPLILLANWADTRKALGVTAAFVLVNSLAGLLGFMSAIQSPPAELWLWLPAAGIGGWLGAEFGSHRLDPLVLRRLLALVLVLGGLRLLL